MTRKFRKFPVFSCGTIETQLFMWSTKWDPNMARKAAKEESFEEGVMESIRISVERCRKEGIVLDLNNIFHILQKNGMSVKSISRITQWLEREL